MLPPQSITGSRPSTAASSRPSTSSSSISAPIGLLLARPSTSYSCCSSELISRSSSIARPISSSSSSSSRIPALNQSTAKPPGVTTSKTATAEAAETIADQLGPATGLSTAAAAGAARFGSPPSQCTAAAAGRSEVGPSVQVLSIPDKQTGAAAALSVSQLLHQLPAALCIDNVLGVLPHIRGALQLEHQGLMGDIQLLQEMMEEQLEGKVRGVCG